MALSNTAVPYYYGQFRDAVKRGDIPVCQTIEMEMNRIDGLIANPGVFYDPDAVTGWIDFCENELTLTDGSDMKLLDSFKLWGEQVYGWYYFVERDVYIPERDIYVKKIVKKRLTSKQYLIVARGAAKSMYGSTHQGYFLTVDPSTTFQVTTAPTMKQADEIMNPLITAITRARGVLFSFLTEGSPQNTTGDRTKRQKLMHTKRGIENKLTNSILEVKPMRASAMQGARYKIATIDEWLSCDVREDVVGAIEQGSSKLNDYLIIAISSEGTIRNGIGDSIKMELMSILKGDYYAPHVSIWYYRLDSIDEVADPAMWRKANPNLGLTVQYEAYQLDVERAENVPSTKNDILAKRFGIPREGYTYFFTYDETILHTPKSYKGMLCALGADFSQGDDFCAFTFLFPLSRGMFGTKVRSYISSLTYGQLNLAAREKYNQFIEEGSLVVLEGSILDMDEVYDDLDTFIIEREYNVVCFGFDPYNSEHFVKRWCEENGSFGVEKVRQGSRTETVPLGEIKKLAGERMLVFDESLMSFCMGNCIANEDTNGNRKLYKMRYEDKIDNVAALIDAWVVYKNNKEAFE
ncbi:MAG: terminase [Clostridiales bacterium]|nr:terminase [Clostridiales bacterium]